MRVASGIGPKDSDWKPYLRDIKRRLLAPEQRRLLKNLERVNHSYKALLDELNHHTPTASELEAADPITRKHLAELEAKHKARFTRSMRRYLGVRLNFMSDAVIGPWMEKHVTESVKLIRTLGATQKDFFRAKLLDTMRETPFDQSQVYRLAREAGSNTLHRARLIAADQTGKALGGLNQIRQRQNGISEYIWSTSTDERVRPTHVANEGLVFAWGSPPATGHPGHEIRCFLPGSLVLPVGLKASVSYRYVGKIVEILLAEGVKVSVTANHPILTQVGWKPAHLVEAGDKLLQHRGGSALAALTGDPEVDDGYSSAENLHRLAGGVGYLRGTHGRRVDLHGNGAGRDEEIEIVDVPSELRDMLDAGVRKVLSNRGLECPDLRTVRGLLPEFGGFSHGFKPDAAASGLGVGGSGQPLALHVGEPGHPDFIGLGTRSCGKVEFRETKADGGSWNVEFGAHGKHGIPAVVSGLDRGVNAHTRSLVAGVESVVLDAEIAHAGDDFLLGGSECATDFSVGLAFGDQFLDTIVQMFPAFDVAVARSVRTFVYDGPVYSFESESQLIIAHGIVTHNCRCVANAVIPEARAQKKTDWNSDEDFISAAQTAEATAKSGFGNMASLKLAEMRWGNQAHRVVDSDAFDAMPGDVIARGLTDSKNIVGNIEGSAGATGIYGDALYFARWQGDSTVAVGYAENLANARNIMYTAKLSDDAVIASSEDILEMTVKLQSELPTGAVGAGLQDSAAAAVRNGIDAYWTVDRTLVVVNRSKVIVDRRSLPNGKFYSDLGDAVGKDREREILGRMKSAYESDSIAKKRKKLDEELKALANKSAEEIDDSINDIMMVATEIGQETGSFQFVNDIVKRIHEARARAVESTAVRKKISDKIDDLVARQKTAATRAEYDKAKAELSKYVDDLDESLETWKWANARAAERSVDRVQEFEQLDEMLDRISRISGYATSAKMKIQLRLLEQNIGRVDDALPSKRIMIEEARRKLDEMVDMAAEDAASALTAEAYDNVRGRMISILDNLDTDGLFRDRVVQRFSSEFPRRAKEFDAAGEIESVFAQIKSAPRKEDVENLVQEYYRLKASIPDSSPLLPSLSSRLRDATSEALKRIEDAGAKLSSSITSDPKHKGLKQSAQEFYDHQWKGRPMPGERKLDVENLRGYRDKYSNQWVEKYTAYTDDYEIFNAEMRKGTWSKDTREMNDGLERVLRKTTRDLRTYRGVKKLDKPLVEGDVFEMPSWTSTSLDSNVARGFSSTYEGAYIFDIRMPKGTRAIITNPSEQEIILPPGARLMIHRIEELQPGDRDMRTRRVIATVVED